MVPPVRDREVLDRYPGVDLGRSDGGVTEDELDVAHVGAPLKEMRRAGVPQDVRRDTLPETGGTRVLAYDQVERLNAESPARDRGDEERRLLWGRDEARAGLPEIAPQSREGVSADRHEAIPASLAVPDPDRPSLLVEVEQVQVAQLRPSGDPGLSTLYSPLRIGHSFQ